MQSAIVEKELLLADMNNLLLHLRSKVNLLANVRQGLFGSNSLLALLSWHNVESDLLLKDMENVLKPFVSLSCVNSVSVSKCESSLMMICFQEWLIWLLSKIIVFEQKQSNCQL